MKIEAVKVESSRQLASNFNLKCNLESLKIKKEDF